MTIDEELNLLDSAAAPVENRVRDFLQQSDQAPTHRHGVEGTSLLRKFSDGNRMSFSQRYRYNEMAQRYAIQSDLWRKKIRIREEGYRRPQDALLSVQGVRGRSMNRSIKSRRRPRRCHRHDAPATEDKPFTVQCSDAQSRAREGARNSTRR